MATRSTRTRLAAAMGTAALAVAMGQPAHAVVVVGGDNGWEVSFDGNVNGFFVNSDTDEAATSANGAGGVIGSNITSDVDTSRVQTGLLPAFFSFNVKSPTVNGLTGSARISFAPQIQNAGTRNNFGNGTQAGSQIDMRELFFNVEGNFGTVSVGRTLSLFQRKNILTDMTLFGVGAQGGSFGGGTTLGRIGYGYVYPQFNARISYKTPDINGFQLEVGMFDPSQIAGEGVVFGETDTPRFEAEASYASNFGGGSISLWFGGAWQEASCGSARSVGCVAGTDVEMSGIHGGIQAGFEGFEFVFSGYTGEGIGSTLQQDADSVSFDGAERDNDGFIAQGSYTFNGKTKIGVSYGESNADETSREQECRTTFGTADFAATGCTGAQAASRLETHGAWTVGVYHDITSWLKVVAEYSNVQDEFHGGEEQESDVFSVGGFFFW